MSWRTARALDSLRAGVNARWPGRDKTSDGTIGDASHATRASDHNPWVIVSGVGVVRAFDVDVDGIDAGWLFEQLRQAGARGDHRLAGGGYLILNGRITASDFSGWRAYTGTNRHTQHGHVSFSRNQSGFDDSSPWSFLGGGGAPAPPASGAPPFPLPSGYYFGPRSGPRESISCMARDGSDHQWRDDFGRWQRRMIDRGWGSYFRRYGVDGMYGETVAASEAGQCALAFQQEKGLAVDGLIGPATWAAAWTAPVT